MDNESELIVQEAVEKLINNRTTIVIAHRLSTIENANKILVLDQGTVAEFGTHQDLLEQEGIYKSYIKINLAMERQAALIQQNQNLKNTYLPLQKSLPSRAT